MHIDDQNLVNSIAFENLELLNDVGTEKPVEVRKSFPDLDWHSRADIENL